MMERIERIQNMERSLDASRLAVDRLAEALEAYESVQKELKILSDYYGSSLWREDFEADERGEIPADLKRGVLSEDAVYNLLTDDHELGLRMMKISARTLEG